MLQVPFLLRGERIGIRTFRRPFLSLKLRLLSFGTKDMSRGDNCFKKLGIFIKATALFCQRGPGRWKVTFLKCWCWCVSKNIKIYFENLRETESIVFSPKLERIMLVEDLEKSRKHFTTINLFIGKWDQRTSLKFLKEVGRSGIFLTVQTTGSDNLFAGIN